ncbi:cyclase family protein [Vampirovibrio chlorellavorus]|uniref:cyclase family protein n=1 Tax=Vampirovibrio chlorellavorus TaxID=758823 RepID=UPI0026EADB04|nr:cyclase family protein [Vampirovibrio chlorellavorus]
MRQTLIDISIPLSHQMIAWPGDPGVEITRTLDVRCGDPATVSFLKLGSHTGTHVDAFSHFKQDGNSLSEMDLSPYIGPALVVEIEDPEKITLGELQRNPSFLDLRKAERVLFKTVNSEREWYKQSFNEHFCHLNPHAADFLVELGVKLVGIDYLSVEAFHAKTLYEEEAPTHHRLMKAGVYILEGLTLKGVKPGWYELLCLPLKLENGDGAPARAVLRPVSEKGHS